MVLLAFIHLLASTPANPLDPPQISAPVVDVVLGVLGLLGAGILVLTFAKLWKDVMNKPAAIAVDIGTHNKDDKSDPGTKRFEVDLTGFVATKTFDEHREELRLRTLGLEKQISDSRHDWRNELQAILDAAKLRDEVAEDWRGEMSDDVKKTALKLAGVETQSNLILALVTNLDAKVDRNNESRRRE